MVKSISFLLLSIFFFLGIIGSAEANYQGTIGTLFTISGEKFGTKKPTVYLEYEKRPGLFKKASAKILSYNDTSINCLWTVKVPVGTHNLFVKPKIKGSSPISIGTFSIMNPVIVDVNPNSVSTGDEITIQGRYFSSKKPAVYLQDPATMKKKSCKVLSSTMDPDSGDSSLQFVIPKWGLAKYNLILKCAVGQVTIKFPQITTISGSIDTTEIGGTGLVVVSAHRESVDSIQNSNFTTTVSTIGTQILLVIDSDNSLRGFTLSQINSSTGDNNVLPVDATSTALSLLFLTPGIVTTDPIETEIRISQLKQLNTFSVLINYLKINLTTKSLNKISQETEFNDLLINCIEEWINTYSVFASSMKISAIGDKFSFGGRHGGVEVYLANNVTGLNFTKFKLSNYGWRFVNVHRQLLDSSNNVIEAKQIFSDETPMPGAIPLSWGSLLTNTVNNPTSAEDWNSINFETSGAKTIEYWIVGPGIKPTSYSLPVAINGDYDNSLGTSLTYYLVYPLVDLFLGIDSSVKAGIKSVNTSWKIIKTAGPLIKLKTLMENKDTDYWSMAREVINVSTQFITVGAKLGAFSSAKIISVSKEKSLAAIISVGAAAMSGANALIFLGYLGEVPHITKIAVEYEGEPLLSSYSIRGRVTYNGSGLKDIAVALEGQTFMSTLTDSDGTYTFSGLQNGSYTITPSRTGYSFTPISSEATINNGDITGKDFTATLTPISTYSISGQVTYNNTGLSGVTMLLEGTFQSTSTDSNGYYTFTGVQNGIYTIRPSKTGYSFTSATVFINTADITGQDFTATLIPSNDITPPTVTSFSIPSAATSLTIPIMSFTASDTGGSGLAGYLVTDTPAKPLAGAADWSTSAPTSHTFTSAGSKTLYAWAKDAAGNVSSSLSASVNITLLPDEGTLKWSYTTGTSSSPAIGPDGTIYVLSSKFYAFRPDGTLKWSYPLVGIISASPSIGSDGTIYVGGKDKKLYAFNPDGILKWAYPIGYEIGSSPAIGSDGTIYLAACGTYSEGGKLFALSSNGVAKWIYEMGFPCFSPAIGSDGTIYAGGLDGKLYAFSPNGILKWSQEIPMNSWCSPSIGPDGTIYAGGTDAKLYAIYPNGTLKWTYQTGYVTYGFGLRSSPTTGSDGTIYVGGEDKKLYALNPDGSLKWTYQGVGSFDSSPAIGAKGTIYIGSYDGNLYAINPNGSLKWTYQTGQQINSSPALGSDGTIYIGSYKFYAINAKESLSTSPWPMFRHDLQHTGRVSNTPIYHCPSTLIQGGDTPETHSIELGKNAGTFEFDYETYTLKDRIIVKYESKILFDSGCIGTGGMQSINLSYSGNSTKVTVEVQPNCEGTTGTDWEYTVNCPN